MTPVASPPAPETAHPERERSFLVEIERFQGPMDLLLHLIRTQDIDIFDIPIARITDQFLRAIKQLDAGDLDSAGEFLEMAATLIRIKAQMLLPRHGEDEDEDPRAELVRRLLEYEQIREVALRLSAAEAERARRFGKGFIEARPQPSVEDVPLETTWEEVFEAAMGVELPDLRIREHQVKSRLVAMEDKIELILGTLADAARIEFFKLTRPWKSRMHEVMTLLAGLELSRRRTISLRQARPFSELWLYRRDDGEDEGEYGNGNGTGRTAAGGDGGSDVEAGSSDLGAGSRHLGAGDNDDVTLRPEGDTEGNGKRPASMDDTE